LDNEHLVMASLPRPCDPDNSSSIRGRIVIDTGSGVHIIGKHNVESHATSAIFTGPPLRVNTANGQIDTSSCINIASPGFQGTIQACVLENSPNVLSVGTLCNEGWTFYWTGAEKINKRLHKDPVKGVAQSVPLLYSPQGLKFGLKVRNNVPYFKFDQMLKVAPPLIPWISYADKKIVTSSEMPSIPEACPAPI
jgi:hypothetical protein